MNKKIFKAAVASVCAACAVFSAVSLAACGGGGTPKSVKYYNKTITFTGKAYGYGFDTKGLVDSYNNGKNDGNGERNTTQRKILEKYWDNIDWDYTGIDPAPQNTDEVKEFLDLAQENTFKAWKDLSFTVTKTDTVTITLNLPEEWQYLGWGTSVTMPLYENEEEFASSTGIEPWFSGLREGEFGVGVKVDGNKRIRVSVYTSNPSVNKGGKNVNMDTVSLSIFTETINEDGSINQGYSFDTGVSGMGSIYAKAVKLDDYTSSHDTILPISFYPEVTITDAE